MRVAHVAFELGLRNQRRHGVHDDDVHAAGANQRFSDFERLLAVVGLRDQQVIHVHAELPRIDRIKRVLRVNERRLPAELLRLGDDMQRHGRLAARFRAVDLDHAPAGEAADAQRRVNREASARDYTHGHQDVPAAQAHDRAFTVVLFNLRYRRCQQSFFVVCHFTPRFEESRKLGLRGRRPGFCVGKAPCPCAGTQRRVDSTTRFISSPSPLITRHRDLSS